MSLRSSIRTSSSLGLGSVLSPSPESLSPTPAGPPEAEFLVFLPPGGIPGLKIRGVPKNGPGPGGRGVKVGPRGGGVGQGGGAEGGPTVGELSGAGAVQSRSTR